MRRVSLENVEVELLGFVELVDPAAEWTARASVPELTGTDPALLPASSSENVKSGVKSSPGNRRYLRMHDERRVKI